MKLLNTAVAGLIFATSSLLSTANAGLVTLDLESKESSLGTGAPINYNIDLTGNNAYSIASDAIFTLELFGNFLLDANNIDVALESLDLGIVLNGNPTDDAFDYSSDQIVNVGGSWPWQWDFQVIEVEDAGTLLSTIIGTATIDRDAWTNIVADDMVNITLTGSHRFLDITSSGSISYEVPEPTTLAIFGLALFGLGARRFSK